MGKKKNKNSSEVPRCQSLVIPLCILKSSHEIKNKRSQESVSQQRRRITVTVRRVNSLQITPLSPPPPNHYSNRYLSFSSLPPSPLLWWANMTPLKNGEASGRLAELNSVGLRRWWRQGHFTLWSSEECVITQLQEDGVDLAVTKKKKKKALMNMSMRSCLGSIGASTEKVKLRRVYSLWGKTTARDRDILTLAYIL